MNCFLTFSQFSRDRGCENKMIQVWRNRVDADGKPIKPSARWFRRARIATEHATAECRAGRHATLLPRVYAADDVRVALEELFYGKCAYCESRPSASSDWNVEHFRPKAGVRENRDHSGYYWLAYEWNNLYMSCQHCNQWRRERRRWGGPNNDAAGGKADQFPLHNEDSRAMGPDDDINAEDRLLIDPCNDNPEKYIGYDLTGGVLAIEDNKRGSTTIRLLNLSRRRLSQDRHLRVQEIALLLKAIALIPTKAERKKFERRFVATYLGPFQSELHRARE